MKVLTIIARPPTYPTAPGSTEIVIDDGHVALRQIAKGIPNPVFAADLKEVYDLIQEHTKDHVELIQIIGHGCPGILSLGYYWSRVYQTEGYEAQLLDSNPYAYQAVKGAFQVEPRQVFLVGCRVGSNQQTPLVARGKTLLTDLHHLWGVEVFGAVGSVEPHMFDRGIYVGPLQARDGSSTSAAELLPTWRLRSLPALPARRKRTRVSLREQRLSFVSLLGVPALGPRYRYLGARHPLARRERALDLSAFDRLRFRPARDEAGLALPEVEFLVDIDEERSRYAHLCAGGEVLKIYRAAGPQLLQAVPAADGGLGDLYAHVVRHALSAGG
jgi:hypothetical protein